MLLPFGAEKMHCARWSICTDAPEMYRWSFDPFVLDRFRAAPAARAALNGAAPREVCRV